MESEQTSDMMRKLDSVTSICAFIVVSWHEWRCRPSLHCTAVRMLSTIIIAGIIIRHTISCYSCARSGHAYATCQIDYVLRHVKALCA